MANQEISKIPKYRNAYQYQYKDENNKMIHKTFPAVKKPRDNSMAIFLVAVGVIAAIPAFVIAVAGMILAALNGGAGTLAISMALPFIVASAICLVKGIKKLQQGSRFYLYIKALKEKNYATIASLSKIVKKSEKFVIRDLQEMMDNEWFFEGHLDDYHSCFMSSDEVYEQYQGLERDRIFRVREEKEKMLAEKNEQLKLEEEQAMLGNNSEGKQILALLEEGRSYIQQIKAANELIIGVNFSKKLDRLEMVCTKIFEQVKKKPEKMHDIRKFMNYYLPTVLKLVNAYYEFDKQPVQGGNIIRSKKEIEASLDKINLAFENLFDQLFVDDALDISTDIEVLSTMLNQAGLLGSDFDKMKT